VVNFQQGELEQRRAEKLERRSGSNSMRQGPQALSERDATATRTERSLYHRANGYNFEAVKIFMPAKRKAGMRALHRARRSDAQHQPVRAQDVYGGVLKGGIGGLLEADGDLSVPLLSAAQAMMHPAPPVVFRAARDR
jgi:hypothetical protein